MYSLGEIEYENKSECIYYFFFYEKNHNNQTDTEMSQKGHQFWELKFTALKVDKIQKC